MESKVQAGDYFSLYAQRLDELQEQTITEQIYLCEQMIELANQQNKPKMVQFHLKMKVRQLKKMKGRNENEIYSNGSL